MRNKITKRRRELLGYSCVDSGTLLIVDPCYIANDYKSAISKGTFYEELFEELYDTGTQVFDGLAVATSTRNGDGFFPIFAEYGRDGELDRIVIDFLAPSVTSRPRRTMKADR